MTRSQHRQTPMRLRTAKRLGALTLLLASGCRRAPVQAGPAADRVVVCKHDHTLTLLRQGAELRRYRVALGRGGLAHKQQAGDNRVPEGHYRIVGREAHSTFHLALRIGYPTPEQRREAAAQGVNPGGDIMIHGIRNGLGWLGPWQRRVDWTRGCIAVTDPEIDEMGRLVPDGTRIDILP